MDKQRPVKDDVREDHGQDAASGTSESVRDIVVLGYHGLRRGGGHDCLFRGVVVECCGCRCGCGHRIDEVEWIPTRKKGKLEKESVDVFIHAVAEAMR